MPCRTAPAFRNDLRRARAVQNAPVPAQPSTKTVDEMGPVHHVVLYCAVDGEPLVSPLHGLSEAATPAGEYFVLFEPQPLDAVQEATIDLVRAGLVVIHSAAPMKSRSTRLMKRSIS